MVLCDTEEDAVGKPSGEGCGVVDLALDGVVDVHAARLALESVLRERRL
jgi:hypothetical protein